MDNFTDFVVNRIVMNISSVRSSAATAGGNCTWHFSQCKDPVRTLIGSSARTKKGICEILAAKWMALRANGGSLEAWITRAAPTVVRAVGGAHRKDLDKSKLALLAQTFGTGSGENDGDRQRAHTVDWLAGQGVRPRQGARWQGDEGFTGDVANGIIDRLTAQTAPYRALLSIHGKTFFAGTNGHIMAVDVGAHVAYFDPNFGEFTFPTLGAFEGWFRTYYARSHYGYSMNDSYKVMYF